MSSDEIADGDIVDELLDETEGALETQSVEAQSGLESGLVEYETLAHGVLSPRHRKFALLLAQGKSNAEIMTELGYCDSRVSILKKNAHIIAETIRLRDKIFEETIGSRLRQMTEPALNMMETALKDRTNKFKKSEQIDVAKWVLEKIDGKAAQKHDIGENMLGLLMDRLDSLKSTERTPSTPGHPVIDMTPRDVAQITAPPAPKTEEDLLTDWVIAQDVVK